MTEEQKKVRYKKNVYYLKIINNKIDALYDDINYLKSSLGSNLSINSQAYCQGYLDNSRNVLNSSYSTIRNYIIPGLNRKINS